MIIVSNGNKRVREVRVKARPIDKTYQIHLGPHMLADCDPLCDTSCCTIEFADLYELQQLREALEQVEDDYKRELGIWVGRRNYETPD